MSVVLSAFCAAVGIPDPYAALVERARVDVGVFRLQTVRALVALGVPAGHVAACDLGALPLVLAGTATFLVGCGGGHATYWRALAHVRALSQALGHPLPENP